MNRTVFCSIVLALWVQAFPGSGRAESMTKGVDRYNLAVGVQTIGSQYQFTDKTRLMETAEIIRDMGSNMIKFRMDRRFSENNYAGPDPIHPKSLKDLASRDPSIRTVFEMPFYYYFLWVNEGFCGTDWLDADGYTEADAKAEYREMYDLVCYLLQTYNRSGKAFYLGNWEGDWKILGGFDRTKDPDPESEKAMVKWLNNRQKAVDDAKRDTPHSDVDVFHYLEVNLVEKGIRGRPCLTTDVLPYTSVDYVSYSAYEVGFDHNLSDAIDRVLDFIEKKLPPKDGLEEKRVFIGEFGYKGAGMGAEAQKERSVEFIQGALHWGCPYVLYWQLYDNEIDNGKYKGYWLIDNHGEKWPVYHVFSDFFSRAKAFVEEYADANSELPDRKTFNRKADRMIDDARRKN